MHPRVIPAIKKNPSVKSLMYSFGKNEMSSFIQPLVAPTSRNNTPVPERTPSAKKNQKVRVHLMEYSKDYQSKPEQYTGNYLDFGNQKENNKEKPKLDLNFSKDFEAIHNLLVFKPGSAVKSVKAHQLRELSPIQFLSPPNSENKKFRLDLSQEKINRSESRTQIGSVGLTTNRFKIDCSNDFSDMSPEVGHIPFTTNHLKPKLLDFNENNDQNLSSFRNRCMSKIELPTLKNRSAQSSPSKKLSIVKSASNLKMRPSLGFNQDLIKRLENISIKPLITPVAVKSSSSLLIDPFRTPKIVFQRETPVSREKTPLGKIPTKFKNQDLILDKLFNPVNHKMKVGN